ncbi:MAG: hypothetical protein QXP36_12675 [Conexivisphaerales archaeon]
MDKNIAVYSFNDRFGNEWVVISDFCKEYLNLPNSLLYKHYSLLKKFYPQDAKHESIRDFLALDITGKLAKKINGRKFVISRELFDKNYFSDSKLWHNISSYPDIYSRFNQAKQAFKEILSNNTNTDSSPDIYSLIDSFLKDSKLDLKKLIFIMALLDRHLDDVPDINALIDEKVNFISAKIIRIISTYLKNFIVNPNQITPCRLDTTERSLTQSGVQFVLHNGAKMPLVTAKPDKNKFFTITDFLLKKGYSPVYAREFGSVISPVMRAEGIQVIKYLKSINSDAKSGVNYYPISALSRIDELFTNWIKNTKTAVILAKNK